MQSISAATRKKNQEGLPAGAPNCSPETVYLPTNIQRQGRKYVISHACQLSGVLSKNREGTDGTLTREEGPIAFDAGREKTQSPVGERVSGGGGKTAPLLLLQ